MSHKTKAFDGSFYKEDLLYRKKSYERFSTRKILESTSIQRKLLTRLLKPNPPKVIPNEMVL